MIKIFKFLSLSLLILFGINKSIAQSKSTIGDEGTELEVFIPNAFTPNGDGLNDNFQPAVSGADIEYYSLVIYDRNGELVFSTENPDEFWNGSGVNSSDFYAGSSLYIYYLKLKPADSVTPQEFKGHVVLLR